MRNGGGEKDYGGSLQRKKQGGGFRKRESTSLHHFTPEGENYLAEEKPGKETNIYLCGGLSREFEKFLRGKEDGGVKEDDGN